MRKKDPNPQAESARQAAFFFPEERAGTKSQKTSGFKVK
jgi:hypothetical protein